MATNDYLIKKQSLDNIANAIHSVNGESAAYSPATMKTKIDDISDDVTDQSLLISQIQTALNNKITPAISVSASGLVTAGSSTHQLSSSDDADFVAANIAKDITIFGITGTHEGGTDTSDATATASDILSGKTAYAQGSKITGTIATKTSSDLSANGATVTVPSGYYASQASKSVTTMTLPSSPTTTSSGTLKTTIGRSTSTRYLNIPAGYNSSAAYYTISAVANGTQGTPTATKSSVSNHSVTVTPSCTDTTGYISGTTKTGTAVTVSASELVSGSETKTANGTYNVTNLATLVVSIPTYDGTVV